jgi:carboxyl-terminal processing protease
MRYLISLTAVTIFVSTLVVSSLGAVDITTIEPASEQSKLYREIVNQLATKHYLSQPIDDQLSKEYLDTYIERLDPIKRFFLASDIAEFNQWQHRLDDFAKRGDIKAGFYMFNRLSERAIARLNANISLLEDKQYKFDFTKNDTIVLDPDERNWFASETEAEKYWLKVLTDSMIRLILSGKEQPKARELLIKRYKTQLNQYTQRNSNDVFQLYVNALASLYDPHTSYFTPRSSENFQINMSLSLEGIGAQLTTEDEYTEVVRIIPGGPADLQGILKPEDRIIGVAQGDAEMVDVIGWRIDDVVDLIRGKKGSTVRLEISTTTDNPKIISIVRDKVKLEEKSAQSDIIHIKSGDTEHKLGVIEIPAFYMDFEAYRKRDPNFKSTSRDVKKILLELKKQQVDGVILDLRNNGGGSLFEATALTDLFIDFGPVVQIRDSAKKIYRDQRAKSEATYKGPLIVLVNRLSASASEIFAGAIQDYGRALVVGSQSFGKGTVQNMAALSSGHLKLTISKFYRVSGGSTQHRGIIPDIAFPNTYDATEVGESQQDNALPWDQIHPVPHQYSDALNQLVDPLKTKHKKRAYQNHNFISMVEQLDLSHNWDTEKSLSLNLEARKARTATWDTELLAIENKRRTAQGLTAYPTMEAWEEQQDKEDSNDKPTAESDPILYETGYILGDQIMLASDSNATTENKKIAHNPLIP